MLSEPVVSEYQQTREIERDDIHIENHLVTRCKGDRQRGCFRDEIIQWSVKQFYFYRLYWSSENVVFLYKYSIDKIISRAEVG